MMHSDELNRKSKKTQGYCYRHGKPILWQSAGSSALRRAWKVEEASASRAGESDNIWVFRPTCTSATRSKGKQRVRKFLRLV